MLLRELFLNSTKALFEGGNLRLGDPSKGEEVHQADEIDLAVHNRSYMVGILNKLLYDIDNAFAAQYKQPLWSPELLQSQQFLGGSSLHFFNTKGITDDQFVSKKPKVGDIDTQVNKELEPQVHAFLTSIVNKKVGNSTFLGFDKGNEQYNGLFLLDEIPVKIQIDFEFGRYDPETNTPDDWFKFSHSSAWNDVDAGIKGVFHKYLYRAIPVVVATEKYVAKSKGAGKNKHIVIDGPIKDKNFSFAVASKGGGGLSAAYEPYIDPETNMPMEKNGIPVMTPTKDKSYNQNLSQHIELLFGAIPDEEDLKLQQSFLGSLELMNKYFEAKDNDEVVERFIDICFEPGGQMITREDPARDREIKFAAIDSMLENLNLTNVKELRALAEQKAKAYADDYQDVEAYKKANPNERQPRAALAKQRASQPVTESEVKANLRKGMPHLRDLKPVDLLDLIDELHDGNGRFKLQNIPLNVKVDGFGGRFGKDAQGRPFMGTSRTPPRYEAGFAKYHQAKGTTDPEILGRAQLFDQLFTEMMNAVELVDSKLGPDFLVNKQVTCEVLFLPFASETPEGKLKFVGIHYDKLPEGVELALVPFHITDATSGDPVPNANRIIKDLTKLGQQGSVMFIDNSLTQNGALDVTEIIPPMENIEELKAMLTSTDKGSLERKRQVKAALEPVALALEKAIIKDPNIVGKDMLGKDYEGIVLNTRLGPVKITSSEQKQLIADKQAAIKAARPPAPGDAERSGKTAIVTAGSFVGHRGHQQLVNIVLAEARKLGADPYVYISSATGADDPIPADVKLETWQQLYPTKASIFQTIQEGGSVAKKIEKELITSSNPPPYDRIVVMVGADRYEGFKKWMQHLEKRMKNPQYPGFEHVKIDVVRTERDPDAGGTGISFTALRNILTKQNVSEEEQLQAWENAFDVSKLGTDWIKNLMDITRKGMGVSPAPAAIPKELPAPIATKLKERQLAEQIEEMARTLGESSQEKISKRKQQSTKGLNTYGDSEHVSGDYTGYRLGMAVAGADGKTPIDMKAKSWVGKKKTTHPYTQEEQDMLKQAYKVVGASYNDLNKGDMKSRELDSTYKVSPTAKAKRNQYGI